MLPTELLQRVLDCVPDATIIVDESGAILVANRPTCDLLGYTPSELQGQSVELLVPERFRLAHIGHRILFTDDRRDRTMETGHGLFVRCKDGSELSVAISLGSVPHGLETLTVAAIRADARHT
jgi:PAS domain S-box-containing protein